MQLASDNEAKDTEIKEKDARIKQLEPLADMGGRMAIVVHSFKNNLNFLCTAMYYLEQEKDAEKALEKLRLFNKTITERISNILMLAKAGQNQEPEILDVGNMLDGINSVYLQDRAFVEHAKIDLRIGIEGVLVRTVKWDFILLMENLLKNALDATIASGKYGIIRITLEKDRLTIANDGGSPTEFDGSENEACLEFAKAAGQGSAKKVNGSGYGLPQVVAVCRKNGWNVTLRARGGWIAFELTFPPLLFGEPAPAHEEPAAAVLQTAKNLL